MSLFGTYNLNMLGCNNFFSSYNLFSGGITFGSNGSIFDYRDSMNDAMLGYQLANIGTSTLGMMAKQAIQDHRAQKAAPENYKNDIETINKKIKNALAELGDYTEDNYQTAQIYHKFDYA